MTAELDDIALGRMQEIDCSALDLQSYRNFLSAKTEPEMRVDGRKVLFRKSRVPVATVEQVNATESHLFDYQRFIVALAAERRRFAIFADCGLGKTGMALAWIRIVSRAMPTKKILIVAPLAVIPQWLAESKKFYGEALPILDIHNESVELWAKSPPNGINVAITNHDKFHKKMDLGNRLGAIVLDESSIIKDGTSATRNAIIGTFRETPFRLALSATPAPNDRVEYGNHATFLGYARSNAEFLSMFFVNRDNGWEIKPHGMKNFYRYLANWSVYLRSPKTYGFDDNLRDLPDIEFFEHNVPLTPEQVALAEVAPVKTLPMKRRIYLSKLSKGFTDEHGDVPSGKVAAIANLVGTKKTIVWTEYNDESAKVTRGLKALGFRVAEIAGSTHEEERSKIVSRLESGEIQVIVSKPRILGFGLNLQFVTNQIWSGLTHSYEQFYQAIKRSHRYGAKEKIEVHLPMTEFEHEILENIRQKKATFEEDTVKQEAAFVANQAALISDFTGGRVFATVGSAADSDNIPTELSGEGWKIHRGDSIQVLRDLPPNSLDLAVFSPPFASLFTYSDNIADMGNSGDGEAEFNLHFEYFLRGLMAAMRDGRIVCCHVSQLATLKYRDGFVGVRDFRGATIRAFQKAGFTFFGEWAIAKNPQMQAIKEKVRTLSFAQLDSNRLGSKPGFSDFILIFKKPGDTPSKLVSPDGPNREEWIEWACGVWTGISESYTLNTTFAKSEDDVKHICPMNLEVLDRCIRMYSAPGETVLDPFNGIGSTGVVSMCRGRNYVGIELKPEYFLDAAKNLAAAKDAGLPPIDELRKAVAARRKIKAEKGGKKSDVGGRVDLLPAATVAQAIENAESVPIPQGAIA